MVQDPFALFALLFAFRTINALLCQTFFQPDEYWQSLEIAHSLVFGYGYKTWEWRDSTIRSPLYPLLLTPVYWVLKACGLDDTALLVIAPRIAQANIAASSDYFTYKLGSRLLGKPHGTVALFCSVTNFFNAHASTRTFSNSTETALTAAALSYWPWEGTDVTGASKKTTLWKFRLALVLAGLACIMRPSGIVLWAFLGLRLLTNVRLKSLRGAFFRDACVIGLLITLLTFSLDSWFYGRPTFTPLNFVLQNVINNISLFYGSNPWHFYLLQALPVLSWTQLPYIVFGLFRPFYRDAEERNFRTLVGAGGATILAYSMLGHKEFRFIQPLQPIFHILAARSLVYLWQGRALKLASTANPPALARKGGAITKKIEPKTDIDEAKKERTAFSRSGFQVLPSHALFITLTTIIPTIYFLLFHARGQISIMSHLRAIPREDLRSVGFLMPCHSTPWQSHLHLESLELGGDGSGEGGRAWFITCEPPIGGQDPKTYRDQSDYFYDSPLLYLRSRFPRSVDPFFPPSPFPASPSLTSTTHSDDLGWKHTWPSHLVMFQSLLDDEQGSVREYLQGKMGYVESGRVWNSHWHEDERRRGDIVVLKWGGRFR